MGMEIRIAETKEERDEVFRFRYQIYVEEMQIDCSADHKKKKLTDDLDKTAHIFYAQKDNQIIATGRMNLKKRWTI